MKIEIKKGTIKAQGVVIEFESGSVDGLTEMPVTNPVEDFNFKAHAGDSLGVSDEVSDEFVSRTEKMYDQFFERVKFILEKSKRKLVEGEGIDRRFADLIAKVDPGFYEDLALSENGKLYLVPGIGKKAPENSGIQDMRAYVMYAKMLIDSGTGLSSESVYNLKNSGHFNEELYCHGNLWYNRETYDKLIEADSVIKESVSIGSKEPFDNASQAINTPRPKVYNDFIDLIKKNGSATRADLEKATGCSKPTSGNVVNYLKRDGVITKIGRGEYALVGSLINADSSKDDDYRHGDIVKLKPVPFVDEENDNIKPDEWMLEPGKNFAIVSIEEGSDMIMLQETDGKRKSLAYKHWLQ